MDKKKKIEDLYNPDKKSQKERVVIGLSGGIDSYVMAFLLKIQKYELIGLTIVNGWDDYSGPIDETFSCHINQSKIDEIKEFCRKIGISHELINISAQFKDEVIEPWIADKLLGRYPTQCWNCHELRIETLYQAMQKIGADHMATGHYAKLFHNEAHGSVFVHTSNDEENDQSALLSRLSHEVLKSLILPLSDLTKKEVIKLAENFGLFENGKRTKIFQCLKWKEDLSVVFEKKVSKKFLKEGDISNEDNTLNYGQHYGVFHHSVGEEFNSRESGRVANGHFGEYSYGDKRIIIVSDEYFKRNRLLLVSCRFSEEVSWLEPIKAVLVTQDKVFLDCWVHPKTLTSAYLELEEEHKFLNGDVISVIKKKGRNSKVYLTGEVLLLSPVPKVEEGEKVEIKANSALDF